MRFMLGFGWRAWFSPVIPDFAGMTGEKSGITGEKSGRTA